MTVSDTLRKWLGGLWPYFKKNSKKNLHGSASHQNPPVGLNLNPALTKPVYVTGRFDYAKDEFVFVAFQSLDNKEILEFGYIMEVEGEHYIVKLLTHSNETAVVTRNSLRIAGIA